MRFRGFFPKNRTGLAERQHLNDVVRETLWVFRRGDKRNVVVLPRTTFKRMPHSILTVDTPHRPEPLTAISKRQLKEVKVVGHAA